MTASGLTPGTTGGWATLAIVVVNYGTSHLLEQNLWPVAAGSPDTVVVVVDNYSTHEERQSIVELCDRAGWSLVPSDQNRGFGAGVNMGVTHAIDLGAESFLLLNPDATISQESLALLRRRVTREPYTLVAPTILTSAGRVFFDGIDLDLDSGRMFSSRTPGPRPSRVQPWLTGACLMLSLPLWERVGGFDERYFLYWEDVDFSRRVTDAGGQLRLEQGAIALHDEGGSQVTQSSEERRPRAKSTTYYYYNIRNRLLFASIHLGDADSRRWRRNALPLARDIVLQGGRRQLLRPGPPIRSAVTGLRDGWRLRGFAQARPEGTYSTPSNAAGVRPASTERR